MSSLLYLKLAVLSPQYFLHHAPDLPTTSKPLPPTSDELKCLFSALSKCKSKPAILSLIANHSSEYVPKALDSQFPQPLSTLFDPENLTSNYLELLDVAKKVQIETTSEQCAALEKSTRKQANSRLWFQMRAGRVTASRFKAVCHTDPAQPSVSLLLSICYPEMSRFKTAATEYGCKHEAKARQEYGIMSSRAHQNFAVSQCGFFIHPAYPFVGASPDGLVSCACCPEGVCEIKV